MSALLSQGDTRRRMARLVTEVMSPAVPIVVVIFIVAVDSAGAGRGLLLGLVAAFFSAGLPYGIVLMGVRCGRLTDHHLSRREQRPRMMAIALASLAAGLLLLLWLDAPPALFALVASMVAGLALTLAVIVNRDHLVQVRFGGCEGCGGVHVLSRGGVLEDRLKVFSAAPLRVVDDPGAVETGVIRTAHPRDRRVRRTELTVAGRVAAQRGDTVLADIEEQMTTGLTDTERSKLLDLLLACIRNLDRADQATPRDAVAADYARTAPTISSMTPGSRRGLKRRSLPDRGVPGGRLLNGTKRIGIRRPGSLRAVCHAAVTDWKNERGGPIQHQESQ